MNDAGTAAPRTDRAVSPESLAALQTALRGEHAAVYVLSYLAAQTSESASPERYADLLAAYEAHRDGRDALVARVSGLGATPAAAATSYAVPGTTAGQTPGSARVAAIALLVERRMTDVYGTLVAETAGEIRASAIRSMDESAARQLQLRGRPEIFPGTGGSDGRSG